MPRTHQLGPLLACATLIGAGAGCDILEPECAFVVDAVAADGDDNVFVGGRPQTQTLFRIFKRNPSGGIDWRTSLPVYDATPIRLLAPASGGGVVALGGGALATRFDDAGAIVSVVGYATGDETHATLTSEDRVVAADATAVRMFERDGSAAWALSLPDTVASIPEVAADGDGGGWLAGRFAGPDFPPLLDGPASGLDGGTFLIHFDRDGRLVGGRAWQTGITISALTGGDPLIALGGAPDAGVPELGVPPITPGAGQSVAVAFDGSATAIWAHRRGVTQLVRDGQGTPFAISLATFPPGRGDEFTVTRWDAAGAETGTNAFPLPDPDMQHFRWRAAPAGEGAVLAGIWTGWDPSSQCGDDRNTLVRVRADLTFELLEETFP